MRIADLRIRVLMLAPLGCLLPGIAFAQGAQCAKAPVLKNEVQMTSFGGGADSIPAKINGTDQNLTLATASEATQISADLAKTLKLDVKRNDTVLHDDAGNAFRDKVTLDDFSVGTLHGTKLDMPLSPGGGRGGRGGGGGQLGLNLLMRYDMDIDFGNDKLRLFAQDHCPGAVLYWQPTSAVGTVPITIDKGRVTVPVMVDGKPLTGVIDTTSFDTSTHAVVAERVIGLKLGDGATPADTPSRNPSGQTYRHTGTITIGALALSNVALNVQPDLGNIGGSGGDIARLRLRGIEQEMAQPEVKIGMDVLRKLHLYMAFGEKKLYVTTTTTAGAAPPGPAAPPAAGAAP